MNKVILLGAGQIGHVVGQKLINTNLVAKAIDSVNPEKLFFCAHRLIDNRFVCKDKEGHMWVRKCQFMHEAAILTEPQADDICAKFTQLKKVSILEQSFLVDICIVFPTGHDLYNYVFVLQSGNMNVFERTKLLK